jgi:hypothetical protein
MNIGEGSEALPEKPSKSLSPSADLALREYIDCYINNADKLDDFQSSADVIASAIVNVCKTKGIRYINEAHPDLSFTDKMNLLNDPFYRDQAISLVLKARAAKRGAVSPATST